VWLMWWCGCIRVCCQVLTGVCLPTCGRHTPARKW